MFAWFLISATLLSAPAAQYKDTIGFSTRAECEKTLVEIQRIPPKDSSMKCVLVRVFFDLNKVEAAQPRLAREAGMHP